jgi:hypothetical protein
MRATAVSRAIGAPLAIERIEIDPPASELPTVLRDVELTDFAGVPLRSHHFHTAVT